MWGLQREDGPPVTQQVTSPLSPWGRGFSFKMTSKMCLPCMHVVHPAQETPLGAECCPCRLSQKTPSPGLASPAEPASRSHWDGVRSAVAPCPCSVIPATGCRSPHRTVWTLRQLPLTSPIGFSTTVCQQWGVIWVHSAGREFKL